MKKGYPVQTGKKTWKELEQIRDLGYSYFFTDWLDLILSSLLSLTENLKEIGISMDIQKASQGKYNDRYMEIVKNYSEGKIGERAIDHFQRAFKFLMEETLESEKDVIGEIYQAQITYGEHGQFFTPEHITDAMSKMLVPKSVDDMGTHISTDISTQTLMDPCCGSGRFILSMAKEDPDCYFIGQDIDERCCKMAAINMFIFDLEGEVRCGNALAFEINKRWILKRGGFIWEDDKPRKIEKEVFSEPEQIKHESVPEVRTPKKEVQLTL